MITRKIIVDSETFWQVFAHLEDFVLAFDETGKKEEKGYFKDIPVYIKNDKL